MEPLGHANCQQAPKCNPGPGKGRVGGWVTQLSSVLEVLQRSPARITVLQRRRHWLFLTMLRWGQLIE
jgi:hypothetical protein